VTDARQLPQIRPAAHRIETATRHLVLNLLSDDWIERAPGERDYGVDLTIERFPNGTASGEVLLLQLKGTEKALRYTNYGSNETIQWRVAARFLMYAELFATPVLLVVSSSQDPERFFFLWVQRYIAVALRNCEPAWRHQKTVTIHVPVQNCIPGAERWFGMIAEHGPMLACLGEVMGLHSTLTWMLDAPQHLHGHPDSAKLAFVEELWQSFLQLQYFERTWRRSRCVRTPHRPWPRRLGSLTACKAALSIRGQPKLGRTRSVL